MALVEFTSLLEAADSLPDLARRLGDACLDAEGELRAMRSQETAARQLERVEAGAARLSLATWEEVVADPPRFPDEVGGRLVDAIERARTRQPLDFLGVLRGLCRKALPEHFLGVGGQVGLDRGLPIPFATRPINRIPGFDCTPAQATLHRNSLLDPLPYSLFEFSERGPVRVVLDFTHGDRLDALTWKGEAGLPRIATVHPPGGGDLQLEIDGDRFFDVRPEGWDADSVLALLARAKGERADIAVMPELSLPTPGALEEALAASPEKYPPIVIAGSAHCRSSSSAGGDEIRANESLVYLDGRVVAVARKHHPFTTKRLFGRTLADPVTENLSAEQKTVMVLSGRRTRLAVAICADLDEITIPRLLVAAGVNLLLAPAMTMKVGSFNTALCDVAGYCQGVGAVANVRWREDGKPFLCLVAVPRPEPAEQSAALTGDGVEPPPRLAILDPKEPLALAVSWH